MPKISQFQHFLFMVKMIISLNILKQLKYMISINIFIFSLRSIVKSIYLPTNMTHTKYDMIKDIGEPLQDFFNLVTNK